MSNIDQPQKPNKCKHSACACEAAAGGDYCSEHCEKAATSDITRGCGCGHADCAE